MPAHGCAQRACGGGGIRANQAEGSVGRNLERATTDLEARWRVAAANVAFDGIVGLGKEWDGENGESGENKGGGREKARLGTGHGRLPEMDQGKYSEG